MRIRTRLLLNIYSALAAAVLTILTMSWIFRSSLVADRRAGLALQLHTVAFEQATLRDEYLHTSEARALTQWQALSRQFQSLLDRASGMFDNPADLAILREIHDTFDVTQNILPRIVESRRRGGTSTASQAMSWEGEDVLIGQLILKGYALGSAAERLRQSTGMSAAAMHRRALFLLSGCLLGILAVVIGNSLVIGRSIAGSLAKISEGTRIVGEGDLNHRIAIGGSNELWDLARATNEMAAKLQASLTSIDHLQVEIAERRRVEEKLRQSEGAVLGLNDTLKEQLQVITASRDELTEEIVKRREVESALHKSNEDLAHSNKELEQFAYVASHDLQEPLRMVASYTQLLAQRYEGQLDAKAKKYIDYAVDGAMRMQRLINDLLTYSRIGTRGKQPEATDAHAALGEALKNLAAAIAENQVLVTNDDLPTVRADASQLALVFQNLIGNAIKFHGQEDPRVHVAVAEQAGEWVFSVRDNGIGIEPQYIDRIFVIFQRLHTREEYPGTGIGLAVCKRIVERHGGRIWFESEPGKGSTFFFSISKST